MTVRSSIMPARDPAAGAPAEVANYVAGRWESPPGPRRELRNPGDLTDLVSRSPDSGPAQVHGAVAAAAAAQPGWRDAGPVRRGELIMAAARLLRDRAEQAAWIIAREHGKLLPEARAEVDRSVTVLEYTAGEGRRLRGAALPADDPATVAFTRREPIGVAGLITPWNFPLAIPAWKLAPALVSGCTAVLKPSPLTPVSAAFLVGCLADAGVPPGVINLVHGDREAGTALVTDPAVAGISFTGSVGVGRAIQVAGAPRFLRTQLEMGGKNAALVLADADLALAASAIASGAFGQAGQRCSATSRLVVDRRVHDEMCERLASAALALPIGPAGDPAARLGPVITADRLAECLRGVHRATTDGARVVTGGERYEAAEVNGHFMTPTVLAGVRPGDFIAQEEIFGPVLAVIACDGFEDGLAVVNGVRYGMAAAVFTKDASLALRAVHDIQAGMLHVNRPGTGAYPHLPHVGTKESQLGPPECGQHACDFYTEWRSACVSY
jgi:aldehyde dehydrogenase (NAD+)